MPALFLYKIYVIIWNRRMYMITILLSIALLKYDIWVTLRRKGDLVAENHKKLGRFFMWYVISTLLVLFVFQPDLTIKEQEYKILEKDGKYIHHEIGKSSTSPLIDVTSWSDKSSYIGNYDYVWVSDNGKEKKLLIESYSISTLEGVEPKVTFIECSYEAFNIIEKVLYFPSGIYTKGFTRNMKIILPKEV